MEEDNKVQVDIGIIKEQLNNLTKRVDAMINKIDSYDNKMATMIWVEEQIKPMRLIVYGSVGVMATILGTGGIGLLLKGLQIL